MSAASKPARAAKFKTPPSVALAAVMEDARRAGLLDGEKSEHLSFRAPKALVAAAMRESGATGITELGLLALATLAQPDPVAVYMKRTRGALGPDHTLDF
jgi:hypothetical protein